MTLLLISFIAGVLTILAPCILPLLPVIVGHSVSDPTVSKRRLFVVVTSLGLSIILFTLILKASTLLIDIPPSFWTYFSAGIIFLFGLIMIFPNIWESLPFVSKINNKSNQVLMQGYKKDNIWGDVIIGASLGPIFSACSPTYFVILATVLPVSFGLGILYLFVYAFGLSLSLVVIALLGQKIMKKIGVVSDSRGWFKKVFGVIFILVALGIATGYDKKLQISLLDAGFFDVTKLEQGLLEKNSEDNTNMQDQSSSTNPKGTFLTLSEKQRKFEPSPDISTPDAFINTDGKPINISDFKGNKVVLVDIWTYSCINCLRTLPYLKAWDEKYGDQGLEIIGLHTPEFAFERIQKNVEEAVTKQGIKYPVVMDNDFSTWNAFKNQYWPRKYLIDIDGFIVYDHAGEGDYDVTERAIQDALAERSARLGGSSQKLGGIVAPTSKIDVNQSKVGSPEIYFGSARNEYLANGKKYTPGPQFMTLPEKINLNNLYMGGDWNFSGESAKNDGGGGVSFKYNSKNVYFVGSSKLGTEVEVYVDGKLLKTLNVKEEMLYTLVEGVDYGQHTLLLKIMSPGIEAFTFTFG